MISQNQRRPERLSLPNLEGYAGISLDEIAGIKASNRKDSKYIFNSRLLPSLLECFQDDYLVLEIDGKRLFRYDNQYFDSEDFRLYLQHHNGIRPRHKIRFRQYLDSGTSYFEIKTKNNKGRTEKRRLLVPPSITGFSGNELMEDDHPVSMIKNMIKTNTGLIPDDLRQVLGIEFLRFTLVDKALTERVTIDNELSTTVNGKADITSGLTIAEIKQKKYSPRSAFIQTMRNFSVPETRFSKYCLGINKHYKLKSNRFKPRLLRLDKILINN